MKLTVNTPKKYDIIIERGLLKGKGFIKGRVITDKNLAELYKDLLKKNKKLVVPAGEETKSSVYYLKIINNLADDDRVIGFGGGVVGDLTGFVASTYKRGIKLINIPTTLLAMVDSSIGGKNGINLGNKKNYLGTFYQPDIVLIDPLFLFTLSEDELKNGIAEIIKYSILFRRPDLARLEKGIKPDDEDLEEIIYECCKIKAEIVEKDEYDKGYRHTLNFGHTIGHAIEILYNLSHGEAISIGMIKELEIAEKLGLINKEKIEQIKRILQSNNLSTKLPENYNADEIVKLIKIDKKGELIFALDIRNYNIKVDEEIVKEILSR